MQVGQAEKLESKIARLIDETKSKASELDGVRGDESQRLPGATSFLAASKVLSGTRVGVAWSALGIAIDCFEEGRHSFLIVVVQILLVDAERRVTK